MDSQPGRAARTLLGAPLLNPFDEDIEPQVRKQFVPKVTPEPFADDLDNEIFSKSDYDWKMIEIEVETRDGPTREVSSIRWVLDHLPRRKAQDAFGGRMEHWALLDPAMIDDAVMEYNNASVPRGLWRCLSGSRAFIVEKGARGSRKARVVRSVSCLRKISYRATVIQQALMLRRLYESCGQGGFTPGGTEIAFNCSLLAMLAMIGLCLLSVSVSK